MRTKKRKTYPESLTIHERKLKQKEARQNRESARIATAQADLVKNLEEAKAVIAEQKATLDRSRDDLLSDDTRYALLKEAIRLRLKREMLAEQRENLLATKDSAYEQLT
ncbi:hypothetical protein NX059_007687 [Plenodomus lindquistii]|nr:hypothetical protein NX059_007687 [Plenodomus lindquistii]